MAKIKAPVYSLMAHGWLNKYFYQRTGVVKNPYPIGLFGRYLINSIYYSVKGWNYEMRRTWHGIQAVAKHGTIPPEPNSPKQLGEWEKFSNAVKTWQLMTQPQKEIYNKLKYPEHTSGYNKFIRWYLRTTSTMPIYWGTLQKSSDDSRIIEQKMVDQDSPTIRYPFNFRQYQLFNMVLHQGMGFPDSPVEGQLFYNSSDDKIYVFKNGSWSEVGGGTPSTDTRIATVIVASDGSGDYTGIQDGIDALPAGGGLVFIKNGVYIISSPIILAKSNVTIQGQGAATILRLADNINDSLYIIGDGVSNYSKIHIKNVLFDGNKENQSDGSCILVKDKVDDVIFESNYIENGYLYGLMTWGINKRLKFINNRFTSNYSVGLYLNSSDDVLIQGNNFIDDGIDSGSHIETYATDHVRIIGNLFQDTSGLYRSTAIYFVTYSSDEVNYEIIGNTFSGLSDLFGVVWMYGFPTRISMIGNTIRDIKNSGINVLGNRWIIIGNNIDDVGEHGIDCGGVGHIVKGNQISNCEASGILLSGDQHVCIGNEIRSIQHYGIFIWSSYQMVVTGNIIYDIGLNANNIYSGILVTGESYSHGSENSIYDNLIIGPTYGNRKAYSIREYGAYVDYNLIRGNRCRNAITKEIQVNGQNSEAYDNQIFGAV